MEDPLQLHVPGQPTNGRAKGPAYWLIGRNLSPDFWTFFSTAFCFDLGFAVYFFLFSLYLVDIGFNERTIGLVGGAFTSGSVAGTLPAGWLANRVGLRFLLASCMILAPALCAARALTAWEPAQIGLAFLAGVTMCLWGVCFLPAVARLTTEENRASAFSLIFSVSIGSGALGGVVCGFLPRWLDAAGVVLQPVEVKRRILLASCGIAMLGLIPALRLHLPLRRAEQGSRRGKHWRWKTNSFLIRFLPSMALWAAVLASFTPFANVFLSREIHIPFSRISMIFSAAQIVQLGMGLLTPWLFRRLGLVPGIAATQVITAGALVCLAGTRNANLAVALYLGFSAAQWMSSPGLYNLLMSRIADEERSSAAAMTLFCNALTQSCATAGTGFLFLHFGYPRVLAGIAAMALSVALLFTTLVARVELPVPVAPT